MQLFDTHCHIHSADYPLPITEVDDHAAAANVAYQICVGTSAADSTLAVQFVQTRPQSWASIGVHPHETGDHAQVAQLAKLATRPKVVAVGECGLDYFYNHASKKDQQKALRAQVELALERNLPLIFHVRDAFDDFWPIFDSYQNLRGVVHSFTDSQANLDRILARNLCVGVNGIMTFTKNDWQLAVCKAIPLQNLLLETDAPFLTPAPHRGKVNEPAQVRNVAIFVARLQNQSLKAIATASTKNAQTLFNL